MEPKNIFDFFFSMENPAIYGLLLVLLILVILFLIKKEFISPLTKKKLELENENIKLMALFAEIDPDPILRVDKFGKIISANNTALNDFKGINLIGSEFSNIITDFDIEEIESSEEKVVEVNDRFFNISVREGESLDFRQVYLHDITVENNPLQKAGSQLRLALEKRLDDSLFIIGEEETDTLTRQ